MSKNEFAKNALTLMAGTVLAQAVPVAILPILTRLFTPEDFGVFAIYSAIVSIIGVAATGRYEIAIMLPKDDEDAKCLLQLSVGIAILMSLLICLPIIFFNSQIARLLGNEYIAPWLYLIPVSVIFVGINQSLTYWNNRQKKFKYTAISRVNQSFFQGFSQSGLGLTKISGGLIWGQFIGLFSSVTYLLRVRNNYKILASVPDINRIKQQVVKYQKFPRYGILGSFCDAAAVQMPVLILSKFYSSSSAGIFSLTFRVLNMPTSIISSAIGQVLFNKVIEISREDPIKLKAYIIKIFFLLFIIYLPAVPILIFWGNDIFAFLFGEPWREAGSYASYLVVAVAIRFAVSPLSAIFGLDENIKKGVFWQILYLFTIANTLYFSSELDIENFIIIFVAHEVILYIFYFSIIIRSVKLLSK